MLALHRALSEPHGCGQGAYTMATPMTTTMMEVTVEGGKLAAQVEPLHQAHKGDNQELGYLQHHQWGWGMV